MKLPAETVQHLDDICHDLPRTPKAAALAVYQFISRNFTYGCEENIEQGKWVRYPHHVKQRMNCHDFGAYAYLMLEHLGVDCSLARLENFNNTNQSHYVAVVRGSRRDYFVGHKAFGTFSLGEDCLLGGFSNCLYQNVQDVNAMVKRSRKRDGPLLFFADGQQTGSHKGYSSQGLEKLCFACTTAFRIEDENFLVRETVKIPGAYLHLSYRPRSGTLSFSHAVNNARIIGEVPLLHVTKAKRVTYLTHELSKKKYAKLVRRLLRASTASYISHMYCDYILPTKFNKKPGELPEIIDDEIRFEMATQLLERKKRMEIEYRALRQRLGTRLTSPHQHRFFAARWAAEQFGDAAEEFGKTQEGKRRKKVVAKAKEQVKKASAYRTLS